MILARIRFKITESAIVVPHVNVESTMHKAHHKVGFVYIEGVSRRVLS